ncbi:hypothetical protein AOLI_G00283670, partial [Acnodon oligacanthus]
VKGRLRRLGKRRRTRRGLKPDGDFLLFLNADFKPKLQTNRRASTADTQPTCTRISCEAWRLRNLSPEPSR